MADEYRSTLLIPASALEELKQRAQRLRIEHLPLVRGVIVKALEDGVLPDDYSAPDTDESKSQFPFVLDSDLVDELGGRDRARAMVRWAILEGLDASPFAAQRNDS